MSIYLRRLTLVAALAATFVTATIAVLRPNIVERWGIYASSAGGPPESYPLFLEPFPTKFSCEFEARIIVQSGGHAVCRSHWKLESGTKEQELLWAQFWPSARWIAFCQASSAGAARNQGHANVVPRLGSSTP